MKRLNPLLFEKDGDLNPTWIFAGLYLLVGLGLIGVGVYLAILTTSPLPFVASVAFCALAIAMLLIGALPLNKAKVLAESRVVAEGFHALGEATHFGGSTEPYDAGDPFDYAATRDQPRPAPAPD